MADIDLEELSSTDFGREVAAYGEKDYRAQLAMGDPSHPTVVEFAVTNWLTLYRVQSIFSKEPETIEWLSEMTSNDVLLDVGANVGIYTVLAAKVRGARVFAMEPEAFNFAMLSKNVAINNLCDRVTAYCVAAGDHTGFDKLYVSKLGAGYSSHQLREQVTPSLEPTQLPFLQGTLAVTIDDAILGGAVLQPTHLKIDIDGFEHKVIAGAERALANPTLSTVLLEVNEELEEHRDMVRRMQRVGFSYKPEQVAASYPGEPQANYVFRR